jgi:pimeloyl-ACP methyl ester carboxylesterase
MWIYSSVVDQAHRVRQPVKVMAARRDLMYDPEFQRQTTLITLPQATMEVLDCAHFIPCEEPALLARLIENFCGALPAA